MRPEVLIGFRDHSQRRAALFEQKAELVSRQQLGSIPQLSEYEVIAVRIWWKSGHRSQGSARFRHLPADLFEPLVNCGEVIAGRRSFANQTPEHLIFFFLTHIQPFPRCETPYTTKHAPTIAITIIKPSENVTPLFVLPPHTDRLTQQSPHPGSARGSSRRLSPVRGELQLQSGDAPGTVAPPAGRDTVAQGLWRPRVRLRCTGWIRRRCRVASGARSDSGDHPDLLVWLEASGRAGSAS